MQEKYLHYLWRMKRLPLHQFKLINYPKSSVYIENIGWYNQESGPDFFNGSVILDNIRWQGNIEMHIKSSDWYVHKHHLDKAYQNVILHVVYEYDKPVYIEGKEIPTIELKPYIEKEHLNRYIKMINHENHFHIPCYRNIKSHIISLHQQIEIAFFNRIERKGIELVEKIDDRDFYSLFYHAILKSVGGKTNVLALEQLGNMLPYSILLRESWNPVHVESLLFGCSGLLSISCDDEYFLHLCKNWQLLKRKYNLSEMNRESWKFGGTRPNSFPTMLLAQLSIFLIQFKLENIYKLDSQALLTRIESISSNSMNVYWQNHYLFGVETNCKKNQFSPLFKQNLLINGVIPLLVALKYMHNDFSYMEKAIDLAENIPPENNNIINYWKSLNIFPKNVLESQGLLELKNEFCNFKKCLSCKVGAAILEYENKEIDTKNSIFL
ncbi:MAG: DUF2851 family protein [Brumimicrobium sp.]|nr:DUF2851 family protein [Brumimicrobium sp.]